MFNDNNTTDDNKSDINRRKFLSKTAFSGAGLVLASVTGQVEPAY